METQPAFYTLHSRLPDIGLVCAEPFDLESPVSASVVDFLAAVVSIGLFAYLLFALIKPEKF
jgi:K+-transporting ATPase KdpF subunit